jgi:alpha-mannosidase
MGLEMNNPVVAVDIKSDAKGDLSKSFIKVDGRNVTLEAVKKCEDEDAYIIRFVEKAGARTDVCAELFADIAEVTECDLLERNDVKVDIASGNKLNFRINPFEIKCFKVKIAE